MTFLDTIKNEMVASPPKRNCCRRHMLFGMLAARGEADNASDTVTLRLVHKETVAFACHLIKEQLGRSAEKLPMPHGGKCTLLAFESPAARKFLSELETEILPRPLAKKCPACAASFLKGVFLAAGNLTNPQKTYNLAFSLGNRAESFLPFLEREYSVFPKLLSRRSEKLLYFKDSTAIEDMMTVLGINDAAFLFMNCKIEKQFRNEANRRANCEAGNITRTVNAAAKLLGLLRRAEERGSLSALPEELSAVAKLRLLYPEASLTQLASLTTPPLTKSGVNHRLQKITELLEKQEAAVNKH